MHITFSQNYDNNLAEDLSELQFFHLCVEMSRKGPYVIKIKIEFCVSCSRGHSTSHLYAKITCLAQFSFKHAL